VLVVGVSEKDLTQRARRSEHGGHGEIWVIARVLHQADVAKAVARLPHSKGGGSYLFIYVMTDGLLPPTGLSVGIGR